MYYVEITDTFGGESNYSWVKYFMVKAKSYTQAITKVAKETGWRFRKSADFGDQCNYKGKGACVIAFVSEADEMCIEQMRGNAKYL